ncbi:Bacterial membrane flanked domain protein [Thalassoglobus neptunius]|uniref:Bacterial membrane flanked domain protein n=1 Tax=Thalassoglobus neptunius TaxID=1938619 RepID=A0A5C5VQN8_9PLAN|nr:PH domain-containing protein [Thalassoglobus neptunius]TWT39902.1 Bacterial membrane flanked domain protein [Thalassoglobus neptunius]
MREQKENVLYRSSPAMFRSRPILFVILVSLLFTVFFEDVWVYAVISALWLLIWFIRCKANTLIVTNKRSTQRIGILSMSTSEVWHKDVRNTMLHQSFFQRILGVGTLSIASSGHAGVEIHISGISRPGKVQAIIDDHRS